MRIGLITTLKTNIGDNFIREGICSVLDQIFNRECIEYVPVNKHNPFSVYPSWHPIHIHDVLMRLPAFPGRGVARKFIDEVAPKVSLSHFDKCDLIVQCGAPVFWPGCHSNEWAKPLWEDIVARLYRRIPVVNIAAGSCYPWERQPSRIDLPEDETYLRAILRYCQLTTVRDCLSQKLCSTLNMDVSLIPCTALLAGENKAASIMPSNHILINYMYGGGHYLWDQEIDCCKWENFIKALIKRLAKRHKIAFLCHDEHEYKMSTKLAPELPAFLPRSSREYFNCVSMAKYAILNRMHAAVAMAGIGIPSIAVCTDTRLLMVSQIGLPTHYVKDVDTDIIEEEVEKGILTIKSEQERLLVLRSQTRKEYISCIKKTLSLT